MPLAGHGWTSGSSLSGLRSWLTQRPETLSWALGSSSEVSQAPSRCSFLGFPKGFPRVRSKASKAFGRQTAPPVRFLPLQRFSTRGSGFVDQACLTRSPASSGFGQPPDALIRPKLTGPISYRIRSWGLTLQSLVPPGQPYVVPNASCPLDLRFARFFLCSA